jgi:hypothetical protein
LRTGEETKNAGRWHSERFDGRSKDEMNGDRFSWTRSGRERRRRNFLIISRISRKKKAFQRHEANEKRDGMISSWARSERKRSGFPELDARKKDRGFLSEEEKKPK